MPDKSTSNKPDKSTSNKPDKSTSNNQPYFLNQCKYHPPIYDHDTHADVITLQCSITIQLLRVTRKTAFCLHAALLCTVWLLKLAWINWFQIFTVFWMLFAFFWVIPQRLNFMCWCFGTLCSIFIGG
jgi:hypothetical protein